MKFVRPLLITIGIAVVILATALALARVPSIQRWALLKATAHQPGLKLDVAHISAGASSAVIRTANIERRGLKIHADQIEMEYSLWPALFSHRLSIRTLSVKGLEVDATRVSGEKVKAGSAGAPVAAPRLLGDVTLPFELVLDDCSVEGRASLPGAVGQPAVEAVFDLKGGKFAPDAEGVLQLSATVKNPAVNADVGTLHVQLSLRATQTAHRNFSRVNLTAVVNAAGPTLSEQNQLKITTELVKNTSGENYSLSVDTLMHGAAENLLGLHAALPAGKSEYTGQWTLKARTAQLAPFFLGLALPDFDARGEGRVVYAPATQAMGVQGNLDASANRLEILNPAWKAVGLVKIQAQFDASAEGAVARLQQLNIKLSGENPIAELSAAQAAEVNFSDRRLRIGGVAPGEALKLKLRGVPVVWLAPFVPDLAISGGTITGEFSITGGGDRMQLRGLQPLRVDELTISRKGESLLTKAAISVAFDAVLTDKELTAKVEEFALQTSTGDLFKSQVNVSIPVSAQPPISIKASYSADMPTLLAPWLPKGHIKATGDTDFSLAEGKIEMRSLTTNLTDEKGRTLFKAATLHGFVFDPATMRTTGEKADGDLVSISLGRIPLDWLPVNRPGSTFAGTVEPSEFVVKVAGEKLSLRSVSPFKLAGVSLIEDGEPALDGLAIQASPVVEFSAGSVIAQTGDFTMRDSKGAALLACKGEIAQSAADGMRANFNFTLEVPALSSQPFFTGARAVSGGRATGEVRATLASTKQIEARLTLNGMVARESGQLLPVANVSFRALVDAAGKISVQAPLLLDRAGVRSDLNFALDLTPAKGGFVVDGKLSGEHIELSDAVSVLGVFSSHTAQAAQEEKLAPIAAREVVADKASAWSRFEGRFGVDVKSATAGKDWAMTGLVGTVAIDPTALTLQKLEAAFSEKSGLTAKAGIKFTPGALPYQLNGEFTLTEFDTGRFFKAIEPTKAPTVEGLFSVSGKFSGNGETLDRMFSRTHGEFDLTSRQGVFRGLQRATGKLSMSSKAVELGASVLGSLFGSEKATKAAEKVAGQAYFVDQLAQSLAEFNYDQLNVRLVRDESLNLTLQEIGLISPEVRLLGKGTITYVAGKTLLEQPLSASLSLAARGKVEQLLTKLRLTDGARDDVGYVKTKEVITVGGSLAKPDPSSFFTKIATAKIGELLDSD